MSICLCLLVCTVCLSVPLSCRFVCRPAYLPRQLSAVCMSACLSVCLSVCPRLCLYYMGVHVPMSAFVVVYIMCYAFRCVNTFAFKTSNYPLEARCHRPSAIKSATASETAEICFKLEQANYCHFAHTKTGQKQAHFAIE